MGSWLLEKAHQAFGGQVGDKKFSLRTVCGVERLGSAVTTPDRAFHGGGPAGGGPVSGEEEAGPGSCMRGAIGIAAGCGREGRVDFFDHGRFDEFGVANCRKKFGELAQGEVDYLLTRLVDDGL